MVYTTPISIITVQTSIKSIHKNSHKTKVFTSLLYRFSPLFNSQHIYIYKKSKGAGGSCPPHFENLTVAKLPPPFWIKFKNKLVYFSMEALPIYCPVSQGYNDFFLVYSYPSTGWSLAVAHAWNKIHKETTIYSVNL